MTMRIFAVCLIVAVLIVSYRYYPEVWISIVICIIPALVIAVMHGERINILSGRKLGMMNAAKGNSLALASSFFVPGRVTEFLKPLYYYKTRQLPVSAGISLLIVERIFDSIAVVCIGLLALNLIDLPSKSLFSTITDLAVLLGFLLVAVIVLSFKFPSLIEKVIRSMPYETLRKFFESSFESFREGLAQGVSSWSIILTLMVWSGSVGLYWLFLQFDGGVNLNLGSVIIVFLIGTLGITITFTPGGLGTFEAAVMVILQQYGYDFDTALASAIGLRLVAYLPNGIIAGYVLLFEGFDLVKARDQAEKLRVDNGSS